MNLELKHTSQEINSFPRQVSSKPFKVGYSIVIQLFKYLSIMEDSNLHVWGSISKVTPTTINVTTLQGTITIPTDASILQPVHEKYFLVDIFGDYGISKINRNLLGELVYVGEPLHTIHRRMSLPEYIDIETLQKKRGSIYLDVYTWKGKDIGAKHFYGSLEDEAGRLREVYTNKANRKTHQFFTKEDVIEASIKVWYKLFPAGTHLMLGKRGKGNYKLLISP